MATLIAGANGNFTAAAKKAAMLKRIADDQRALAAILGGNY